MNIAVILPSWVGDTVMATPAIRALKQRFPAAKLIGLGRYAPLQVVGPLGWFDQLHLQGRGSRQRMQTAWRLRKQAIAVSVSFPASESAALMAMATGARQRVGFGSGFGRWAYHLRQPNRRDIPHTQRDSEINRFLGLTAQLGCSIDDRRVEVRPSDEGEELADRYLRQTGLAHYERLIVVNSSGAVAESKLWHTPHLIKLCRDLAQQPNTGVLLHCGPNERDAVRTITEQIGSPRVHSMADWQDLPISLSISLLRRAAVVVSTDSGPRHLAIGLNRPVITIFGPTNVEPTATFNVPEIVLQQPLACQPCWKKKCPLGHHQCMKEVTPQQVLDAVERAMQTTNRQAA